MEIDSSNEQFTKADSPKTEVRQPRSTVTCKRRVQLMKHSLETTSIDEGIQMARSDAQFRRAPRRETRQPDSNAKCERVRQFPKQGLEIVSIDAGIQIN
jgi:hypothetical protein